MNLGNVFRCIRRARVWRGSAIVGAPRTRDSIRSESVSVQIGRAEKETKKNHPKPALAHQRNGVCLRNEPNKLLSLEKKTA